MSAADSIPGLHVPSNEFDMELASDSGHPPGEYDFDIEIEDADTVQHPDQDDPMVDGSNVDDDVLMDPQDDDREDETLIDYGDVDDEITYDEQPVADAAQLGDAATEGSVLQDAQSPPNPPDVIPDSSLQPQESISKSPPKLEEASYHSPTHPQEEFRKSPPLLQEEPSPTPQQEPSSKPQEATTDSANYADVNASVDEQAPYQDDSFPFQSEVKDFGDVHDQEKVEDTATEDNATEQVSTAPTYPHSDVDEETRQLEQDYQQTAYKAADYQVGDDYPEDHDQGQDREAYGNVNDQLSQGKSPLAQADHWESVRGHGHEESEHVTAETNEQKLREFGAALHPVIVEYFSQQYQMFPWDTDDSFAGYFLEDRQVAYQPVSSLLEACRGVLVSLDDIGQHDKLELKIPVLELFVSEDSADASESSFSQILDAYVHLCQLDGMHNPDPLYVILEPRTGFTARMTYINEMRSSSNGLSKLQSWSHVDQGSDFQESDDQGTNQQGDIENQINTEDSSGQEEHGQDSGSHHEEHGYEDNTYQQEEAGEDDLLEYGDDLEEEGENAAVSRSTTLQGEDVLQGDGDNQLDQASFDQDHFDQDQSDQGPFDQGQYDQGQYDRGQYDQGQYDRDQYDQRYANDYYHGQNYEEPQAYAPGEDNDQAQTYDHGQIDDQTQGYDEAQVDELTQDLGEPNNDAEVEGQKHLIEEFPTKIIEKGHDRAKPEHAPNEPMVSTGTPKDVQPTESAVVEVVEVEVTASKEEDEFELDFDIDPDEQSTDVTASTATAAQPIAPTTIDVTSLEKPTQKTALQTDDDDLIDYSDDEDEQPQPTLQPKRSFTELENGNESNNEGMGTPPSKRSRLKAV